MRCYILRHDDECKHEGGGRRVPSLRKVLSFSYIQEARRRKRDVRAAYIPIYVYSIHTQVYTRVYTYIYIWLAGLAIGRVYTCRTPVEICAKVVNIYQDWPSGSGRARGAGGGLDFLPPSLSLSLFCELSFFAARAREIASSFFQPAR